MRTTAAISSGSPRRPIGGSAPVVRRARARQARTVSMVRDYAVTVCGAGPRSSASARVMPAMPIGGDDVERGGRALVRGSCPRELTIEPPRAAREVRQAGLGCTEAPSSTIAITAPPFSSLMSSKAVSLPPRRCDQDIQAPELLHRASTIAAPRPDGDVGDVERRLPPADLIIETVFLGFLRVFA